MPDLVRTPVQLGTLIRRNRKKLGLTQTALGERTGLRQETISLIESGNLATRLDTILGVLGALDLEFQVGARSRRHDIEDLTR